MSLRIRPLFTEIVREAHDFRPEPGTSYIYGRSVEPRSSHVAEWSSEATDIHLVEIEDGSYNSFRLGNTTFNLRGTERLKQFWSDRNSATAYLDITGLPHHVWAPLLRAGLGILHSLRVVYAEPKEYRFHPSPTPGEIFDLSARISGIAPLPGFASLTEERDEASSVFVPTLGFEGARFAYLVEQVQPPGDKVVPIVGVPGFRPEYPFYTYRGNQGPLYETGYWQRIRFAIANCPFSLFYTLEDILQEYRGDRLKIAPIGTKPHAIGAVLFAVINPSAVELVYDHPIRKAERTQGAARLLIYHVSDFAGR